MKRALPMLITVIFFLLIAGCNNGRGSHIGVNAEILEITKEVKGMVVKGLDKNSVLGELCYISCEDENTYFIYVDNDTGEIVNLKFEDFMVGDIITVDVKSVENKYALTSRVQLLSQR